MALEDLSRPFLPVLEDLLELGVAVEAGARLEQRDAGRRRARPRVERHDRDLAALEVRVQREQVGDRQRDDPEAEAARGHGHDPRGQTGRDVVPVADGDERDRGEIHRRAEVPEAGLDALSEREEHRREADDEEDDPQSEQDDHDGRREHAQPLLAAVGVGLRVRVPAPRAPAPAREQARRPVPRGRWTRKDDRVEHVVRHPGDEREAHAELEDAHGAEPSRAASLYR